LRESPKETEKIIEEHLITLKKLAERYKVDLQLIQESEDND
jgi:hypothetical protein